MGIVTKVIGVFSPKAAARREAYDYKRRLLESSSMARGYAGASRTKRTKEWNPGNKSANDELSAAAPLLRARAFDLIRSNPHAANIVARQTDNIVGTGFTPKFSTGNDTVDAKLKELWEEFSDNIDPAGQLDFHGKTHQAVRVMIAGGEVYARRRDRRAKDGFTVPLQVQTLEPDMVDWNRRDPYAANSQNRVVQGIEFDAIGGRRGYWMFGEPANGPRASLGYGRASGFIPAAEVAHLYEPLRDQVHGEPWLTPVMIRLRDLDEYDEAEMIRKKTEACLVGVIIPASDDNDSEDPNLALPLDREPAVDEQGNPIEIDESDWSMRDVGGDVVGRMEPGMFYQARGGSSVEFNTPATSAGYDTYTRTQLRSIAAGVRMPYEVMTGDLAEVSYASGRMGTVEYRRFLESVQWHHVIKMWCKPIGRWFVEAVKTAGLIAESTVVRIEWTAPAFQSISPIDDANADAAEVRSGFASWDEKVRARGYDPDVVAREIEARNKDFDAKKIVLDIDPRQISKNGQKHSTPGVGEEGTSNATGEQDREAAGDTGARPGGRGPRGSRRR